MPKNDGTAVLFELETPPIVSGNGKHLPIILGLKSMSARDGVLEMKDGGECLTFPGPGGYKIEWSPGTKRLPMVPAPSGHLVIPCGKFAAARGQKSHISFCTDHTIE